jgi:hypothetical protein
MHSVSLPSAPVIQQVSVELSLSLKTSWLLNWPFGLLPLNVQVLAFSSQVPVASEAGSSSDDEIQTLR